MAIGGVSKSYRYGQNQMCIQMVMRIVASYENRGYKAFIARDIFSCGPGLCCLYSRGLFGHEYMHFIAGFKS